MITSLSTYQHKQKQTVTPLEKHYKIISYQCNDCSNHSKEKTVECSICESTSIKPIFNKDL